MSTLTDTKGMYSQDIMNLARKLGARSYVVKKTHTYGGYSGGWGLWGYDFFKEPYDTTSETLTEVAHSLNHMNTFTELERPSSKDNVGQNCPKESWEKEQDKDKMFVSHLIEL